MVDVTEFIESNFVKANDDWNGKTVVLITDPVWQVSQNFQGKKQLIGQCQVNGKTYSIPFNKTNAKRMADKYGNGTGNWVGKSVKISVQAILVQGEIKKTLMFEPQ